MPLVGMLLYNNIYSINVVREQVAESYRNTISHHMDQIDTELSNVNSYMNSMVSVGTTDVTMLTYTFNEDDYNLAKAFLNNKLSDALSLYRNIDAFFVYMADRKDYLGVYGDLTLSLDEKERLQKYLSAYIDNNDLKILSEDRKWKFIEIEGENYVFNIVRYGEAYMGAWVNTEKLLNPVRSLKLGDGGIAVLANEQGDAITENTAIAEENIEFRPDMSSYYLSGDQEQFLVVGAQSSRAQVYMYAVIPEHSILSNLPYLRNLIWIISIVTLMFIPLGLLLLSRAILHPLGKVLYAMKKVRIGDWSTRVELRRGSNEFKLLGNSFNLMMDEIQTLRHEVYEEQILKQQEELQRLQLQLNPHFFINVLNNVYNLAKVKNYELIMKMTLSMIRYFRYLIRGNTTFVKLQEELDHTENYLVIQALRFPNKLSWTINNPDYLMELPVPPLIIQSFTENIVKHALAMGQFIQITINIHYYDDSASSVKIQIEDTGKGFSEDVLNRLQQQQKMTTEFGERTGIWNIQRRMKLLYNDQATLHFYNHAVTGGAVVELIIPIENHSY